MEEEKGELNWDSKIDIYTLLLLEEAGLNEKKGKLRKEPTFKTGMREEDEAPN